MHVQAINTTFRKDKGQNKARDLQDKTRRDFCSKDYSFVGAYHYLVISRRSRIVKCKGGAQRAQLLGQRSVVQEAQVPLQAMETESEDVTAELSMAPEPNAETHLVLFVNGLNGHEQNWDVVIENLQKTGATDSMAILASTANMRMKVRTLAADGHSGLKSPPMELWVLSKSSARNGGRHLMALMPVESAWLRRSGSTWRPIHP